MSDKMRCSFSPMAELDLEEIADFIALDNPRRALSFVRELRERCQVRKGAIAVLRVLRWMGIVQHTAQYGYAYCALTALFCP